MTEDEILLSVLDRLDALGIPFMLVGSYASNVHGRPRSTHDADLVVDIKDKDAERLASAFQEDFSLEPESFRRDLESRTMVNLISYRHVFKIDLIPLRPSAFHRQEWARRITVEALGRKLVVASAEDTILSKLIRHRRGGGSSGRQLEDSRDVYAIQKERLDEAHLTRWAQSEGVEDLLEEIRGEA